MFFYKYQVKYYDKVDCSIHTAEGIVVDETYTGAMKNIVKFYPDDVIDRVSLDIVYDGDEPAQYVYETLDRIR